MGLYSSSLQNRLIGGLRVSAVNWHLVWICQFAIIFDSSVFWALSAARNDLSSDGKLFVNYKHSCQFSCWKDKLEF